MALVRRVWFQMLASGLALFVLLVKTLTATDNPNFIPSVIVLGAFLVPVVFLTYVYERVPAGVPAWPTLPVCFLWGGAIGTVVAGVLEYKTLRDLGVFQLLGVGVIEEGAKLLAPLAVYLRGRYRTEADGLLVGVASGMGFAALETMGYAFVALMQSRGSVGALEQTLLVRGLLAPAGHAAWTGLICAVLWRERARSGRIMLNRAAAGACVGAVILHTLWDTFNSLTGPTVIEWAGVELLSLAVALTSLTLLVRRLGEAQQAQRPAASFA